MTYWELLVEIVGRYGYVPQVAMDGDADINIPYGEKIGGMEKELKMNGFRIWPLDGELWRVLHIHSPRRYLAYVSDPRGWDSYIVGGDNG